MSNVLVSCLAVLVILALVSGFVLLVYGNLAPEPLPTRVEPEDDLWKMNRGELVEEAARLRAAVRNLCGELRVALLDRDELRLLVRQLRDEP